MAEFQQDPDWRAHLDDRKAALLDRLSGAVLDHAQRAAPVATGHLMESLRRATEGDTARIGSDLDYSVYVEEGHRIAYRDDETHEVVFTGGVVAPQPYLRPALFALQGDAGAIIEAP